MGWDVAEYRGIICSMNDIEMKHAWADEVKRGGPHCAVRLRPGTRAHRNIHAARQRGAVGCSVSRSAMARVRSSQKPGHTHRKRDAEARRAVRARVERREVEAHVPTAQGLVYHDGAQLGERDEGARDGEHVWRQAAVGLELNAERGEREHGLYAADASGCARALGRGKARRTMDDLRALGVDVGGERREKQRGPEPVWVRLRRAHSFSTGASRSDCVTDAPGARARRQAARQRRRRDQAGTRRGRACACRRARAASFRDGTRARGRACRGSGAAGRRATGASAACTEAWTKVGGKEAAALSGVVRAA
jgi:hypothetical protein